VTQTRFTWFQIFRLGLVQAALGAVVVLTTSTLNRVMVVELALPAMLPGALVAFHYVLQLLRPRLGHGSDIGGRRTPWIIGGMAVLALGGVGAAAATAWMSVHLWAGIALAIAAFFMIGIGVAACGTTLLVLLAKRVDEHRRAAAATIVWVMMIVGFIVTTAIGGHVLDPYSPGRLIAVAAAVSALALILTIVALWNIEGKTPETQLATADVEAAREASFGAAFAAVWIEPRARRFTIFVFISMLAYSAPELLLEPFAGTLFGFTPGETTRLASLQHSGVLVGMVFIGIISCVCGDRRFASMRLWTMGGCLASAIALVNLVAVSMTATAWSLRTAVFLLGLANGIYAIAAIGSMMLLVSTGQKSREGVRMGLWGAAQAIAFGFGGFVGTMTFDVAHALTGSPSTAYAVVFAGGSALFFLSALLSIKIYAEQLHSAQTPIIATGEVAVSETGRPRSRLSMT
jgi:BCD family chlorophyll transporter-like MFS transporter